jgi:hypothetical protein
VASRRLACPPVAWSSPRARSANASQQVRAACGTLKLGRHFLVGRGRGGGQVPGALVRIAHAGDRGQRLVHATSSSRRSVVVDGRTDQRMPEGDRRCERDQAFQLRGRGASSGRPRTAAARETTPVSPAGSAADSRRNSCVSCGSSSTCRRTCSSIRVSTPPTSASREYQDNPGHRRLHAVAGHDLVPSSGLP